MGEIQRQQRQKRLAAARAALLRAEAATGANSFEQNLAADQTVRAGVYHLDGSGLFVQQLLGVIAQTIGEDQWVAVVGVPDVGWQAAALQGVPLQRLITIPRIDDDLAKVLGALVEGFEVVALGTVPLSFQLKKVLAARVKRVGGLMITADPWVGLSRAFPQSTNAEHRALTGGALAGGVGM